jgi:hypothetical protein
MNPEDWLVDYSTAVSIANGNKRVAVKYVPLMLQGTARTWLNSLKPYSVNSWLDFADVFIRNFTSTYKRPPSHANSPCAFRAQPSPPATT